MLIIYNPREYSLYRWVYIFIYLIYMGFIKNNDSIIISYVNINKISII